MSQLSLNIRLPTYLPKLIGKNLKSLGYSNFARHYSRNRCLLSLPQGTKMFQFPWLPPHNLCIQLWVHRYESMRVSPFGYLRISALPQLPVAFRSGTRPSSAFVA